MLLYSNNPGTSEYYKLIIRNITSLIYLLLISHLSNAKPVWNKDQRNVKSNLILNMKPNKLSENKMKDVQIGKECMNCAYLEIM